MKKIKFFKKATFIGGLFLFICYFPFPAKAFNDGDLVKDNKTLYFIEFGLKRPFISQSVFKALGFKLSNVKTGDTSQITQGQLIGTSRIRHPRGTDVSYKGTVYFMGKDVRYPYPSVDIFYSWKSDFSGVVAANSWDLKVPVGGFVEAKGQSNLNFSPPVNNGQSNNNGVSNSGNFTLLSDFFKNDSTALAIASGQTKTYDIKNFAYGYGQAGPVSTDNFAFRLFSGLRMTGYIIGKDTPSGESPAEAMLNRFQRSQGLPVSHYIDLQALQKLDGLVAQAEVRDLALAESFPLYSHFLAAPLNEPPKEHSAALFAITFKELPSSLVVWSEQNFKDYIGSQLSGTSKDIGTDNYQICDEKIYWEYGDNCTWLANGKIIGIWGDDFDIANTMIHEYAHYLDKNLHPPIAGQNISQGVIDTTGFYNITFNTTDSVVSTSSGWTFYTLKRPHNKKNEFVSAYASGWPLSDNSPYFTPYEDFAESFAMYVTEAKTFRELAVTNVVLKQKYDWLKNNVFNGQEYQSGVDNALTLLQNDITKQPSTTISTGAFNVRDYTQVSPDFVWNYKFLNGSQAN